MKYWKIYLSIFCLFSVASCTDTIEIEPDPVDTLLVVDAWLDNRSAEQSMRLTQSQTYFNAEKTPGIEGAIVQLEDDQGTLFPFNDAGGGSYIWLPEYFEHRLGDPGTTFTLTIELDSKVYTAVSTIQPVPEIEEFRQEFRDDELGREDGIWLEFIARDLPGQGNTYWIKTYKNGNFLNKPEEINLAYDAAFDSGSQIDGLVFIPPIRELINPVPDPDDNSDDDPAPYEPGDMIRTEIHSINNDAFAFMEVMRDQILNGSNGIFATPLANTRGNVQASNGEKVLGVFNIAAVSSLEHEVTPEN